jgi:hypothetical protein
MGACLPNASVLGMARLRVGSGIQQRNWSLSRCAAAASPASCRRMGGFPGPKPSLVAIILAIELDQVERDQGGTWNGCRARGSSGTPLACFRVAQPLRGGVGLNADWNERQAKRMPRLFSPTIGAAIAAAY